MNTRRVNYKPCAGASGAARAPQKHQEGGGKPAKNGGRLKPAAGEKTAAANCRAK